jgi:RNA polymerase sigma-70 factor (ECF subfamily)
MMTQFRSIPIASTNQRASDNSRASEAVLRTLASQRSHFLSFIRRRVDPSEFAEDILHASYVRAAEHVDELREQRRAVAWFYRLLRNAIVDHYRRSATVAKVLTGELPVDQPTDPIRHLNTCPCATRELAHLNKKYARALEEVEMGGLSVQSFAANQKIEPGTASVRLHRARRALASRLEAICGSCSGAECFDCTCA